jgi:RNA polymerase sigma-70 factor (ECF subfamily)
MRGDLMPQIQHDAKILVLPATDLIEADDDALVDALKAGDLRAPRVIWQRFAGPVYLILRRSLGRPNNVEDLAEKVFAKVFRRVAKLREPSSLEAFVISVTIRTVLSELRRCRLGRWLRLGDAGHNLGQSARGLPSDAGQRRALARFYDILGDISTGDRIAFVLCFLVGLEVGEVAAALDLSLAAAEKSVARARARVEHHVRQDGALIDFLSGIDKEVA